GQVPAVTDAGEVGEHGPVRDHDALGVAGRARRRLDERDLARRPGRHRIAVAAVDRDRAQLRHRIAETARRRAVGRDREQAETRDPVAQDRAPRRGAGTAGEAERYGDRAEVLEAEERVAERAPVLAEDPDALARADARARELSGDPTGAPG